MQITFIPYILNETGNYARKRTHQAMAAWIITVLIMLVGLRYAGIAVSAFLQKLYEVFIQKNLSGL